MQNALIKNWQRSWGMALALLALLTWGMPVLAMACAMGTMPPSVSMQCDEMNSDGAPDSGDTQQMPCCYDVPVPQSSSTDSHFAVISTDGHINLSTVAFPSSHAPLWALLIASPDFNCDVDVKSTFPLENFSSPTSATTAAPLHGRAPPSLI